MTRYIVEVPTPEYGNVYLSWNGRDGLHVATPQEVDESGFVTIEQYRSQKIDDIILFDGSYFEMTREKATPLADQQIEQLVREAKVAHERVVENFATSGWPV